MKHAFSIWFLLLIACNLVSAQTSIRGVTNTQGMSFGGQMSWQKTKLGLVAAYNSKSGVFLDGPSGTNVYSWTDLTGNGFNLNQYNSTNQPTFTNPYPFSTTNVPAVTFNITSGVNSQHLICDSLAPLFSGEDMPFTILAAVNCNTNGNGLVSMGFGWSSATNVDGSQIAMRFNQLTPTTHAMLRAANTNSTVVVITKTASTTTNQWSIQGFVFTGTSATVWDNLVSGNAVALDQGTTTLNEFTIGNNRGANGNFRNPFPGRFGMAALQIYTNALSGSEMTNAVTFMQRSVYTPEF